MLPDSFDNLTLLLASSAPLRDERVLRFTLAVPGRVSLAATSGSAGASVIAFSVGGVDNTGSSADGVAIGVELEDAGADVALRLIFARRCVDHIPCIDRFSAFGPYLVVFCKFRIREWKYKYAPRYPF